MTRSQYRLLALFLVAIVSLSGAAFAQVNVLTWHNDNGHTGQNLQETILTPANVNSTTFGKLFSYPVDGMIYAQPLYVQGVTIKGSVHNAVYVTTENDSVYAFYADSATLNPTPLWKAVFAHPPNVTPEPCADNNALCNVYPVIGITRTPVINLANQSIYFATRSKELGKSGAYNYFIRLHSLNITTGAEQFPPTQLASFTPRPPTAFSTQTWAVPTMAIRS
jgi:hypothetical protein